MTILVIAEYADNQLSAATRSAVTAASQIGGDVHVLVAGSGAGAVAEQAGKLTGVAKVLHADAAHYAHPLAEEFAALVASIGKGYSHILAAATTFGKDVLPRTAALLDAPQISDIVAVHDAKTFTHPIYAGNVLEKVQSNHALTLLTVRATAFDKAADGGSAAVESLAAAPAQNLARYVGLEAVKSERPELTSARVVVSGGRGFGSAENFKKIEPLADKLGAAIGASRAAVDAGYVPNDYQVGQTGKIVAPELYIALGISGAIQHLAGMKDSKVIVAINKDENAPIFDVADYGLVADIFTALPELEAAL
jgi:electron transfer flavoprotein alpha subunit